MGEAAQLITSIATLLGVGLSIYLALKNQKALGKVREQTNGMLAHMSKQATEAGHAAGVEDERERAAGEAAEK